MIYHNVYNAIIDAHEEIEEIKEKKREKIIDEKINYILGNMLPKDLIKLQRSIEGVRFKNNKEYLKYIKSEEWKDYKLSF